MPTDRVPNRLAKEKSPYLLKHAYNPVDWYPWGEEAFQKAKLQDKPIFLSVGYSSCHWCNVMERESFEDEAIASVLNERFVPIKVDREERPEVDEVYMKAVMAITGQGGWPLSVFLTPDLKPFYGGTYFPPSPREGMPGFLQVLVSIAGLWEGKKGEVERSSREITELVVQGYELAERGDLSSGLLEGGYAVLLSAFDAQFGGFGGAPKFPLPSNLEFLLRYHVRTGKESALNAVTKSLDAMARGGIRDHLGGGFHRYSTDRYWLVPHFEKMLYDNALLARVYLEAYQVTRQHTYRVVAEEALGWILREMRSPKGLFYSAQDADTTEGEGWYYTWTKKEVEACLGEKAGLFCECMGVGEEGNHEGGRSVFHVVRTDEELSRRTGRERGEIERELMDAKRILLDARGERNRPLVDDKALTSWNGLAISSMAYAYQVLREERYLQGAATAAQSVLSLLWRDGNLSRRYRDGEAAIPGKLDDYSYFSYSLVDLYETTLDPAWLKAALSLAERMTALFWDEERGGFFLDSGDGPITRVKEGYDGPVPSGNSVAVLLLLRLGNLTGSRGFREMAERTLKLFAGELETSPSSHTFMLSALGFWLRSKEIVLAGERGSDDFERLLVEVHSRFLPEKVLAHADGEDVTASLTGGKVSLNGKPTAYVCENFVCTKPVTDLQALGQQLDARVSTVEGQGARGP